MKLYSILLYAKKQKVDYYMRNYKTKNMILCAMFVALIAVGAFIKIPVPAVPFTLQYLFTMLAGLLLGAKLGFISVCIYIALGLAGLPVFASGGGISYIFQPSFGYIIGFAVGTFVTGSSTSSSVLFSSLQKSTAETLNMNPLWLIAANTVGSTAGKIISPQSIAVATAATATVGKESVILTKVMKYFVLFVAVYGAVALLGAGFV